MKYLLISFQFLSFSLGLASLVVSIILYYKYKYKSVKYYIIFLSIFTIRVLLNNILFAIRMDNSVLYYYLLISYQISSDISLLFLFIAPFLLHHFLSVSYEKAGNTVLLVLVTLTAAAEILPYLLAGAWSLPDAPFQFINIIPGIIIILIALYLPVLLVINIKLLHSNQRSINQDRERESRQDRGELHRSSSLLGLPTGDLRQIGGRQVTLVKNISLKVETKGLVILTLAYFYSFLLFDFLVSRKSFIFIPSDDRLYIWTHLAFYLFWNILFLVFTARFFYILSVRTHVVEPDEIFFNKFAISGREQEIVRLILQGLNNQEIAEKCFISPKTVKNHVHSIYKKTGVNSRMELSFLIQQIQYEKK